MKGEIYLAELPPELAWVNCEQAPLVSAQRGKAVLLNFWCGSSIACLQQAQELAQLQQRYADGLCVLGIHTPKHLGEAEDARVAKTANRWHLRYPVANDREWILWRQLGIEAWPTAVLLDHTGKLVAIYEGQGRRAEIEAHIERILDQAAEQDLRSFELPPRATRGEAKGALRFPTRMVASESHLYLADTGFNRVLELHFDGRINRQFGSGNPGHWDARNTDAGFRDPVGLAVWKDTLYVADTGNHAVRRVRLLTGEVETIAGNGHWGQPAAAELTQATASPLASPMDLAMSPAGDRVFVAMAGLHQIWQYDLGRGVLSAWAGNGREDLVDGTGTFCSLAQPTGLAMMGDVLYVLDAATSALRSIRLSDLRVGTVIPGGMYAGGLQDGVGGGGRMCHPCAIHADSARKMLWIADTLNHRLRAYSLLKGELKTLNLNYELQAPAGVCVAQQAIWITNTDAHELLKLDLKTGRLSRLPIAR
jgi:DNA-binding beta-propeller fold protein YncE/thiol-disulfide isomerase/thioredoxin